MRALWLLLPLLGACNLDALLGIEEPNCDPRQAFYPDADGDGVGEATTVYIGCEAPDGFTEVPPPTGPTFETDTDAPDSDTDAPDSDTEESDPPDSDTDPSDTDAT